MLEACAASVDSRSLSQHRRDALRQRPAGELRDTADPLEQPALADRGAPPTQRRPALLEGGARRDGAADRGRRHADGEACKRECDRRERVATPSGELAWNHEHDAAAEHADVATTEHRGRHRARTQLDHAHHATVAGAVPVDLQRPAYGPARASAVEAVAGPDRVSRGRSVSQLLMPTALRINLEGLREIAVSRSTTGSFCPLKLGSPSLFLAPNEGLLRLLRPAHYAIIDVAATTTTTTTITRQPQRLESEGHHAAGARSASDPSTTVRGNTLSRGHFAQFVEKAKAFAEEAERLDYEVEDLWPRELVRAIAQHALSIPADFRAAARGHLASIDTRGRLNGWLVEALDGVEGGSGQVLDVASNDAEGGERA